MYVINLKKKLIIKDLELFGQDIKNIKQNPEGFLKLLAVIEAELQVNINSVYRHDSETNIKKKFPEEYKLIPMNGKIIYRRT